MDHLLHGTEHANRNSSSGTANLRKDRQKANRRMKQLVEGIEYSNARVDILPDTHHRSPSKVTDMVKRMMHRRDYHVAQAMHQATV
jgi:5-methylcytosine-specific restriction endonuclease McrBC regulatory subunit McrC